MQFLENISIHGYQNFIRKKIESYSLDLTGKIIFTEVANGAYQFNGLLPLIAKAKKTYLKVSSSKFGNIKSVEDLFLKHYVDLGLNSEFVFVYSDEKKHWPILILLLIQDF